MEGIKIIECPRDAMQGMHEFVPTANKVSYINTLLKVGFDTIDFGSFVSPKAIPQMRDTAEVLKGLENPNGTKLLAIIANARGAQDALAFEEIDYLGYPFSISETFQKRNTNATLEESLGRVEAVQNAVFKAGKKLVVYLSMGFGNPYGDPYHPDVCAQWMERLSSEMNIRIFAPSDTIGSSNPESITSLFSTLLESFPELEIGAHLHTTPETAREKVEAALSVGVKRMDGAIRGFGGCPMAKDDLTGNMPTERIVEVLLEQKVDFGMNLDNFKTALEKSTSIFGA